MSMTIWDQPKRYGSMTIAKSGALVCILKVPCRHRWQIACFGNKGHYQRVTGICAHVELIASRLTVWHRSRMWYLPFGDSEQDEVRVPMEKERKTK